MCSALQSLGLDAKFIVMFCCRKKNLSTVCSALQSLGLDATVNERDDIVLGGTKVGNTL